MLSFRCVPRSPPAAQGGPSPVHGSWAGLGDWSSLVLWRTRNRYAYDDRPDTVTATLLRRTPLLMVRSRLKSSGWLPGERLSIVRPSFMAQPLFPPPPYIYSWSVQLWLCIFGVQPFAFPPSSPTCARTPNPYRQVVCPMQAKAADDDCGGAQRRVCNFKQETREGRRRKEEEGVEGTPFHLVVNLPRGVALSHHN